jgi:hypothetical protein
MFWGNEWRTGSAERWCRRIGPQRRNSPADKLQFPLLYRLTWYITYSCFALMSWLHWALVVHMVLARLQEERKETWTMMEEEHDSIAWSRFRVRGG